MSSIQSISTDRLAGFSAADGGDPSAYAKALLGITQEGVLGSRRESIGLAKEQLIDRARLLALDKLLASLRTMSDGKGILLGDTLAASEAAKAELARLGVAVTTEKSYFISVETFDSNGKSIPGTKHVATPTEKAAAEAAALTTAANSNGVEVRTSGTGNSRKVYTLHKKEEALTASTADLAGLKSATTAGLLKNVTALERTLTLPGALAVESDEFEARLLKVLAARDKTVEVAREERGREVVAEHDKELVERRRERNLFEDFKADRSDAAKRADPSSSKGE